MKIVMISLPNKLVKRESLDFDAPVFSVSTNILRQHSIITNPTGFLSKQNAFY